MKKVDELETTLEHMENRTQWHKADVEKVQELRNELSAVQNDGELSERDKENNKVKHQH